MQVKNLEMEAKNQEMEAKNQEMAVKIQEMEVKNQEMEVKNQEIEAKTEELTKENTSLRTRVEELTKQEEAVTSQLSAVQSSLSTAVSPRDLPIIYTCGFQDYWTQSDSTITYDTLTTDFNNADRPGGGDGKLDIVSGQYTAGEGGAGYCTVSVGMYCGLDPGRSVDMRLYRNGKWYEG